MLKSIQNVYFVEILIMSSLFQLKPNNKKNKLNNQRC